MKAKDIKPGVVYGYRRGKSGSVWPIVLLAPVDAEHLYQTTSSHRASGTPAYAKSRSGAKPGRGAAWSSPTIGYPAVIAYHEGAADVLTRPTLQDFEATASVYWRSDGEFTVEYTLVTTLGHIIGPYADAVAAAGAERAAYEAAARDARVVREAAKERAAALVEALSVLGVAASVDDQWSPSALVLSLDEVEKLLARP